MSHSSVTLIVLSSFSEPSLGVVVVVDFPYCGGLLPFSELSQAFAVYSLWVREEGNAVIIAFIVCQWVLVWCCSSSRFPLLWCATTLLHLARCCAVWDDTSVLFLDCTDTGDISHTSCCAFLLVFSELRQPRWRWQGVMILMFIDHQQGSSKPKSMWALLPKLDQAIKIYFRLHGSLGRLHRHTASLRRLVIQMRLFENQTQNSYQVQIPVPCVKGICERFSSSSSSTKPEGTSIYKDSPFTSCSDFNCFVVSTDLMTSSF